MFGPRRWSTMARRALACVALLSAAPIGGCTGPDQTFFVYRLPYETGTNVLISNDHLTHPDGSFSLDLVGIDGEEPYPVVAARPGVVRIIADSFTESCTPPDQCRNTYVWIQHTPGLEWSKYSHVATGSVSGAAGLSVGDEVEAGQFIGHEGNIGMVSGGDDGRHLHFEVVVPDDPDNPTPTHFTGDLAGPLRIPRWCSIPGGIAVDGDEHVAEDCPE